MNEHQCDNKTYFAVWCSVYKEDGDWKLWAGGDSVIITHCPWCGVKLE